MHKELAKDGLVVLSLSIDEEENEKAALTFLTKVKATFPNYVLHDSDEARDALEKKIAHKVPPVVHVFDRSGKKVKTIEDELKTDEFDKFIQELLKAK